MIKSISAKTEGEILKNKCIEQNKKWQSTIEMIQKQRLAMKILMK